jgi:predicted hydrocarbon binding protein
MNDAQIPNHHQDKLGKILILAMEEVLGSQGVSRILGAARLHELVGNPCPGKQLGFEQISRIQGAMEQVFGLPGGHGVALRCGRASFKYSLREFGKQSGFTNLEFRLLPFNARVQAGAMLITNVLNENTGQDMQLSDQGDQFVWEIERCPVCWGRHAKGVSCHLTVGLLQESLNWVSNGKYFNVHETHCIAKGDSTCTFVANKKPLD